ncbi:MAG: L,D-transpeptidase [Thermomicrobiales bacterium]|nr:L,D-transpeptidase [Thermomicrobiales bacterium]
MGQHRDRGRWRARGAFRGLTVLVLAAIAVAVMAPTTSAQEWSPPRTVWLESSGHTLDGVFLDAWRSNSAYLGNPISEEQTAKVPIDEKKTKKLTVQYFENVALAYSPDDPRGDEWTVHALPLGIESLERDAKELKKFKLAETGSCGKLSSQDCRRFADTGHTVRWGFQDFWEKYGEQMVGMPLTEEFESAKGETTQYFERVVLTWTEKDGVRARPIVKELAKTLKIETEKVGQPLDVPIYDESLFQEPIGIGGINVSGPGPIQGGYKEIVISISAQSLWAYEGGSLVVSTLVSTGTGEVPETVTPIGFYSVHTKLLSQTMEGTISNEFYSVPDVPWVMYFDWAGNAIHGAYWHNNFGTPMSHGCVNLPLDVAEFLYGWAPEGTAVTVIE